MLKIPFPLVITMTCPGEALAFPGLSAFSFSLLSFSCGCAGSEGVVVVV